MLLGPSFHSALRFIGLSALLQVYFLVSPLVWAAEGPPDSNGAEGQVSDGSQGHSEGKSEKGTRLEEEDFSSTPSAEYGEFNEASDEDAEQKFFQFGRFFGVSLGLGFEFLDGYRGALWQGGFPLVDVKLHYWFDFNVAIDIGFSTVSQYFEDTASSLRLGHVDVNMLRLGVDVKYYFDVRGMSAPISFANPYILLGAGAFSKTENSIAAQSQDSDTSVGVSAGAGLEFVISPRKTYFEIEGKVHLITFKDTYVTRFAAAGIPTLTGNFYTLSGNLLFTW